ncbi:lipase 3-like [Chelonus insularis]|uniref:lipase 3-like n=1 Tax=Chelonus insularis TaxID=460826 RepID=UPI00158B6CA7|nr:lipase 3-like [Chelonus insularis]
MTLYITKCIQIFLLTYLIVITVVRSKQIVIRYQYPDRISNRSYGNFVNLAHQYGYEAEEHIVVTKDYYLLEIFRIDSSPKSPAAKGKPVVLLQHGLMASSDVWGLFDRSLAYRLADEGYDVWIGNCRGNYYSQSNVLLTPDDPSFWNFTWHETGTLDLAGTIDYIRGVTRQHTLTVIGHSTGGTALLILLSEKPEYNKIVNLAITVGSPVIFTKKPIFRSILSNQLKYANNIHHPTGSSVKQIHLPSVFFSNLCQNYNLQEYCKEFFDIPLNYGFPGMPLEKTQTVYNDPNETSRKFIMHFFQTLKQPGEFRKYDYKGLNVRHHGQPDAPAYKLNNIVTKLVIFYAKRDLLCTRTDVEELARHVSTNAVIVPISDNNFSHNDFFLHEKVHHLFHNKLLQIINDELIKR